MSTRRTTHRGDYLDRQDANQTDPVLEVRLIIMLVLGFSPSHWHEQWHSGGPVFTLMKFRFAVDRLDWVQALKEWVKQSCDWKPRYFFARLRQKMTGYRNYYGIRGNSRRLQTMWHQIFKLVYKWLNRRSQRRSYTQNGLTVAMAYYALPKPHIISSLPRRPLPKLWEHM